MGRPPHRKGAEDFLFLRSACDCATYGCELIRISLPCKAVLSNNMRKDFPVSFVFD